MGAGHTRRLIEMGEGGQVIGCFEERRVAQRRQTFLAIADFLNIRDYGDFLQAN